MSIETHFLLRNDLSGLQDLDRVVLLGDVDTGDGERVEAGTEGTIVAVYPAGRAYLVEFAEPVSGLATVAPTLLTLAVPTSR